MEQSHLEEKGVISVLTSQRSAWGKKGHPKLLLITEEGDRMPKLNFLARGIAREKEKQQR